MATANDQLFLIADSSALVSLISVADTLHQDAVAAAGQLSSKQTTIIVPYDVYAETLNLVGKKASHAQAVEVARLVSSTTPFVVIDSAKEARRAALQRFARLPHSVSYTDCVVMAVADEYQTKRIFGFDAAFAHNGYQIIERKEDQPAA